MGQPRFPAQHTVIDGISFPSKRQARRYCELKLAERAGEITNLKLEPRFPIFINEIYVGRYTADFRYTVRETGEVLVEDVKSSGTRKDPYYRFRKRAAEAFHGIKILEVGT